MHERRLTGPHAISTSSLPSAPFDENIGVTPPMRARARGPAGKPSPARRPGDICIYYIVPLTTRLPASRHTVGARATLCPPRGSDGGMHTVFRSSGPKLGVSNVPNWSPRVAGLTHASVVTIPKMG
eukprot:scaffold52736_cov55-Phaeocystis_antarctica.AAC.1